MFYKMIEKKSQEWYSSDYCTVKDLIRYIINTGEMRDAQIEAIKIYLFLKIALNNKPLKKLVSEGAFNSLNLQELPLSVATREYLENNPAAATVYEYSCITNDQGEQMAKKVAEAIEKAPSAINYMMNQRPLEPHARLTANTM